MNAERGPGAQPGEDVQRLARIDMAVGHHLARAVGTDREERQPHGPCARGLVRPAAVAETGVAGIEQIAAGQPHREAGPERAVAIRSPARTPMMDPLHDDRDAGPNRDLAAPIARDRGDAVRLQDGVVAERRHDQRAIARPEPLERRHVHMVVMIVADEDDVDPGQVVEADAGRAHPARSERGKGEA
jgi:hypothetical protein